jgi:hypothetical protein
MLVCRLLQMSKMLDILEVFLNLHGYTYNRLDGSTKPEERQVGGGLSCHSHEEAGGGGSGWVK